MQRNNTVVQTNMINLIIEKLSFGVEVSAVIIKFCNYTFAHTTNTNCNRNFKFED